MVQSGHKKPHIALVLRLHGKNPRSDQIEPTHFDGCKRHPDWSHIDVGSVLHGRFFTRSGCDLIWSGFFGAVETALLWKVFIDIHQPPISNFTRRAAAYLYIQPKSLNGLLLSILYSNGPFSHRNIINAIYFQFQFASGDPSHDRCTKSTGALILRSLEWPTIWNRQGSLLLRYYLYMHYFGSQVGHYWISDSCTILPFRYGHSHRQDIQNRRGSQGASEQFHVMARLQSQKNCLHPWIMSSVYIKLHITMITFATGRTGHGIISSLQLIAHAGTGSAVSRWDSPGHTSQQQANARDSRNLDNVIDPRGTFFITKSREKIKKSSTWS
jgi:hypothetical protein